MAQGFSDQYASARGSAHGPARRSVRQRDHCNHSGGRDGLLRHLRAAPEPASACDDAQLACRTYHHAVAEFRAKAFQAAVDKARELGWLV